MKIMTLKRKPTVFIAAGMIASAFMFVIGCSERITTASVTGINYTDATIAGFQVIQPDDFDNRSPTQETMAYGAGGQMCCYTLPYNWHEGLKIELKVEPDIDLPISYGQYQHEYNKRRDEGRLYQYAEVDVSRYEPGKAQSLWIQFLPNNQYRAIATDLDPTHPDFPSDMRGWPVPSVAFRHKLWEAEVDRVRSMVKLTSSSISEMQEGNDDYWKNKWNYWSETSEVKANSFHGYQDENFRKYMKEIVVSNFKYSKDRLGKLIEVEPK